MSDIDKKLAWSICGFLQNAIDGKTIKEDDAEGIEGSHDCFDWSQSNLISCI